jgi:predicted RNase H-like nuclease (RuvC/YqgF family)
MTTDTPRTDAIEFRHCPPQPKDLLKKHEDSYALSRELERELNELWSRFDTQMEAEAEVERLKKELADWDYGTRAKREQERAEKAEAEVERLKEKLETAVYGCGCDNYLQIYCDKHNPYKKTK